MNHKYIILILIIIYLYYIYNNIHIQHMNNDIYDKIIIFDTFCGLCNQFYDIQKGINFCLKNNIKFTFRYS